MRDLHQLWVGISRVHYYSRRLLNIEVSCDDAGTCGLISFSYIFPAPSIYENVDIKKGILLQLFGGSKKDFAKSGRSHFRYPTQLLPMLRVSDRVV